MNIHAVSCGDELVHTFFEFKIAPKSMALSKFVQKMSIINAATTSVHSILI